MNPAEVISLNEQKVLLQLARNAVQTTVQKGRKLPSVESLSMRLREKRGVFVTLWMDGDLRGCIGFPYPIKPLGEAVQDAAVSSALQDFRFSPVKAEELSGIEIEISVLTQPRPIEADQIVVGVHGLIVTQGNRSGLLLPQVAMEYRWDAKTFLEQTCVKAGLPVDAWTGKAQIQAFEAQVFSESDIQRKTR